MIKYFCDRCGRGRGKYELFTVTVTPPEVWAYSDPMAEYYEGDLHFCTKCMQEITNFINAEETE